MRQRPRNRKRDLLTPQQQEARDALRHLEQHRLPITASLARRLYDEAGWPVPRYLRAMEPGDRINPDHMQMAEWELFGEAKDPL